MPKSCPLSELQELGVWICVQPNFPIIILILVSWIREIKGLYTSVVLFNAATKVAFVMLEIWGRGKMKRIAAFFGHILICQWCLYPRRWPRIHGKRLQMSQKRLWPFLQRLPLSNSKLSSPNEIEVPFESKVAEKHDNPYVENSLQSSKALLHVFLCLRTCTWLQILLVNCRSKSISA